MEIIRRWVILVVIAFAPLALMALVSPGNSNAAECGPGTVYDPSTDSCVVVQPPPPPPPPPYWNGDITPYFSVGFCVPIPFVPLCFSF